MNKFFTSFIVLTTLLFSACSTHTGWTPTVDPYGNPNSYRLDQDMAECRQLALRAAGEPVTETAKGIGVGGLVGAAAGAALGAATGDPGKGAAIGAVVGGFGGGIHQGYQSDDQFERAYINCLRHRGHYVLN